MEDLKRAIKQLIIDTLQMDHLTPEGIDSDAQLFGGGLDLDSVDALEIAVEIERAFGVRIPDSAESRSVFRSVTSLAEYVSAHRSA